jgi:hypothetical protein
VFLNGVIKATVITHTFLDHVACEVEAAQEQMIFNQETLAYYMNVLQELQRAGWRWVLTAAVGPRIRCGVTRSCSPTVGGLIQGWMGLMPWAEQKNNMNEIVAEIVDVKLN